MKLEISFLLASLLLNVAAIDWLHPITNVVDKVDSALTDFDPVAKSIQDQLRIADFTCREFKEAVIKLAIKDPKIEEVSFQHRTPCQWTVVSVDNAGQLPQKSSEFNVNNKTVVFVTGWLVNPDKEYINTMAKAFHCRGGYNFLVVNTGGYLNSHYLFSAYRTEKLGKFIAIGLQNLQIPAENIHLIGHSLGAQIVGSAGRNFYELTGQKVARITGLDPARPCFAEPIVFARLGRDDAEFVDIIHTNAGSLGTEEAIGHVDFFVGGLNPIQAACPKVSLCSHERAIYYYAESVYRGNERNFIGRLCLKRGDLKDRDCYGPKSPMGLAIEENVNGTFYLEVNSKSPYGLNAQRDSANENENCGQCLMYKIN